MHLLTHDETGAASVARAGAVALAERPRPRGPADGSTGPNGPASGQQRRWRRVRRALYVLLGLAVVGPLLAFAIGWVIFDVPGADEAASSQVGTFTFADGVTPVASVRKKSINRVLVTIDKVPEPVQRAVLSAEDRSFFSNPGFDIGGIGRAVYNQLTGGTGGGSTITQQYVKVSTGQDEATLWRKYKEVVLAVKISREQTKAQILENYLNTIYLGRGAYGIQAAADAYFGKKVEDLSVSEGAMLAGIIQSPSNWDPAKNPDRTRQRWTFVLDGMVEQNWLSPAERAQQAFPENWLPPEAKSEGVPDDERHHIYQKALAELNANGISEDQINAEGLTITTTIDPQRQAAAVKAVQDKMKGQPEILRESLVSMDPKTGAIVAYYGGPDGLAIDYASEALRPPGSSFKPFVFAAALEGSRNIGLGTLFDGTSPRTFEGASKPVRNAEESCGRCSVKEAMTKSVNTVFYEMGLQTGLDNVIALAHRAGIPEDVKLNAQGGISLGDQDVHPVDMATAYATFAADGVRHDPYIVSKVVAADGRILFDRTPGEGTRVMTQQVARNVTESLVDVPSSSKFPLAGGRPVAAKTGTHQLENTANDNKDAWTVGYTPSLVTAVWVGTDKSDPIRNAQGRPIFGSMLPGPIFKQYMDEALKNVPKQQFSPFVPMGQAVADQAAVESRSGEQDRDRQDRQRDQEQQQRDQQRDQEQQQRDQQRQQEQQQRDQQRQQEQQQREQRDQRDQQRDRDDNDDGNNGNGNDGDNGNGDNGNGDNGNGNQDRDDD